MRRTLSFCVRKSLYALCQERSVCVYAGQTERFSWPSLKLVGKRGSAARVYAGQTERFSWPSLKLVGKRGSAARDFAEGSGFAHAFLAPQFEPPTPKAPQRATNKRRTSVRDQGRSE